MDYLKRKLALKRQLERVNILKYRLEALEEKELLKSLEEKEEHILSKDFNIEIDEMEEFTKLHNKIMRRV